MKKDFDLLHSKLLIIPVLLASIVASVYLLQIIINFLSQFNWLFITIVYAYLIYVLIAPIDKSLQKLHIPATLSLYLSFFIIFAVLTLIVFFFNPIVVQELANFSDQLKGTDLNGSLGNMVNNISGILNIDPEQLRSTIFNNIRDFGVNFTNNLVNFASNAIFTFAQLVIALIFGYFFIKDGAGWFDNLLKLLPEHFRDEVKVIGSYFNKSASSFIQVQFFMALIYGVINFIVMSALGINFALTSSLVAFMTFIIPGIGPVLAVLVPIAVTILFDINKVILLIIILLLVQQLILNILIPKIYGDKMGVHPIVILLAILIGFQFFGVIGAFITLPVITVIINVASIYYGKVVKNQE